MMLTILHVVAFFSLLDVPVVTPSSTSHFITSHATTYWSGYWKMINTPLQYWKERTLVPCRLFFPRELQVLQSWQHVIRGDRTENSQVRNVCSVCWNRVKERMVRRPLVTHFKKTLLTNHTQSFSKSHHNSQLFYPIPLNLIHSPNILECSFSFWTPVLISVMSPWAFIFSRQFSNSSKSINSIFSPSRWVHTRNR